MRFKITYTNADGDERYFYVSGETIEDCQAATLSQMEKRGITDEQEPWSVEVPE